jgi:hypothetical protein
VEIYLDGLERSGNQFLSYAIGDTFGCRVISQRNHKLSVLKSYKKDLPFIVPVRDALPSIISSKVYRDTLFLKYGDDLEGLQSIDFIIDRYKEYTQYLLDNPIFFIAPFHEFINDHNKVIEVILKTYPGLYIIEKTLTTKEIIEKARKNSQEYMNIFDINNPELGGLPRQDSKEKQRITDIVHSDYLEKISVVQANIDKLYKRYYDLA